MNKKDIAAIFGGVVYAGLGVVLLATVGNLLDKASVYGFILPVTFVISGALLLASPQPRTIKIVSSGLIGVGVIALLVRYTSLSSTLVNTILGVVLIAVGISILSRVYYGRKHSAAKTTDQ